MEHDLTWLLKRMRDAPSEEITPLLINFHQNAVWEYEDCKPYEYNMTKAYIKHMGNEVPMLVLYENPRLIRTVLILSVDEICGRTSLGQMYTIDPTPLLRHFKIESLLD